MKTKQKSKVKGKKKKAVRPLHSLFPLLSKVSKIENAYNRYICVHEELLCVCRVSISVMNYC